jgi:hypothetical protein
VTTKAIAELLEVSQIKVNDWCRQELAGNSALDEVQVDESGRVLSD